VADLLDPECNFCGKPKSRVRRFIRAENADVAICDECVGLCLTLIGLEDRKLFDQMVEEARPSN
jgi:ATP-dependent protease Clp ATPase subunit